jgi:hypothetical protein
MFLDNSRYSGIEPSATKTRYGREVLAVRLRRLPDIDGEPRTVLGNDQLDIIADRGYGDSTRFWHIADANTELDSTKLVAEEGEVIKVPKQ